MPVDPQHFAAYAGREQAAVKHFLVDAYLERLIMITAQAKYDRIAYVDAFAGPWNSGQEDLTDTSFARAVEVMEGCRIKLARQFGRKITLRALFVERGPERHRRLERFSEDKSSSDITITALHDDFSASAQSVADWIRDDEMGFVLVDPTGWKDVIAAKTLAPLLRKRNVELLINVMWNFIKLASGHASQQENLAALFGDGSQEILAAREAPAAMRAYLAQLKESAGDADTSARLRAAWFPVEFPTQDRVFYYLAYATHHEKGIIVFLEESERAPGFQREMKFSLKQQRRTAESGIVDMFGDMLGPPAPSSITLDVDPRAAWLARLPVVGAELMVDEAQMADLAEQCGCRLSQLQSALRELIDTGVVRNQSAARRRTKNAVNYRAREIISRLK